MKIGYNSFGRSVHNYGLANCLLLAKEHGFKAKLIVAEQARDCDLILLSCYWWDHFYDLVKFIIDAKIDPRKGKPFVLVGGFQFSQNPMPIDPFITAGFIGDGEEALTEILLAFRQRGVKLSSIDGMPGLYVPGRRDRIDYRSIDKMRIPLDYDESGTVRRVEITRGCRFKCAFCALAFHKPYRETPLEQIESAVQQARTKNVALFGPERTNHTQYDAVEALTVKYRKNNLASDVRIDSVRKVKTASHIRFGLEGLSLRLRRMIGKHFPDDMVVKAVSRMRELPSARKDDQRAHGHNCCLMYLIVDLPSETIEDYDEFTQLMEGFNKIPDPGTFTLYPSANVFIPTPHTPMQWFGINPFRDYNALMKRAFRGPTGRKDYDFKLVVKHRLFSPSSRIRSMLTVRGDERAAKVIWNLVNNKGWKRDLLRLTTEQRAREILRFASKHAGIKEEEMIGEYSTAKPLPWSFIHTYFDRAKMLNYHAKIQERMRRHAAAPMTANDYEEGEKVEVLGEDGEAQLLAGCGQAPQPMNDPGRLSLPLL